MSPDPHPDRSTLVLHHLLALEQDEAQDPTAIVRAEAYPRAFARCLANEPVVRVEEGGKERKEREAPRRPEPGVLEEELAAAVRIRYPTPRTARVCARKRWRAI